MRVLRFCSGFLVGVVAILATATDAHSETVKLELKRLPSSRNGLTVGTAEHAFQSPYYQSFYTRVSSSGRTTRTTSQAAVSKAITKEPKYVSENPLRGVAKLGSQEFGFALDVGEKAPSSRLSRLAGERFTCLYFDLNRNKDLTDDQVIKAEETAGSSSYSYFPRVDVTIEADGTEVEYAFHMRAYSRVSSSYRYARAYLYGAAYREGEISLGGKTSRIVLVDYNSNGRFDDAGTVMNSGGALYAGPGDMIYVDADPSEIAYRYGYDVTSCDEQHQAGELLFLNGQFYKAEISAAGDQLTLTPCDVPVGYMTNPNEGYRALVYGDQGMVKVCGDANGKAPVPAGQWKLLSYTIDRTKAPETGSQDGSLVNRLSRAIGSSSRPSYTIVSARAKSDYPSVEVREGESVALPFGAPFKAVVTASRTSSSKSTASLSLSIVGAGGEVCSNLLVDGSRPKDPQFTIIGPDDKEVTQGVFKYG